MSVLHLRGANCLNGPAVPKTTDQCPVPHVPCSLAEGSLEAVQYRGLVI